MAEKPATVGQFISNIILSILGPFVWVLLGSGFYKLLVSDSRSTVIFPDDQNAAPYVGTSNPVKGQSDLLAADKYSFPYSWCEAPECDSGFKKWFVDPTKESYAVGRRITNSILDVLKKVEALPQSVGVGITTLILFPLAFMLLVGGAQLWGILSFFILQLKNWRWWGLLLTIFGVSFMVASTIGSWQSFQMWVTLMGYGAYLAESKNTSSKRSTGSPMLRLLRFACIDNLGLLMTLVGLSLTLTLSASPYVGFMPGGLIALIATIAVVSGIGGKK